MPNPTPAIVLPESMREFRELITRSDEKLLQAIAKIVQIEYPDYRLNLTTEGGAPPTPAKRRFEERLLELLRKPVARNGDVDWAQVDAMTDLVGMRFASAPRALRPFLRTRWPKVRAQAADCFAWIGKDAILPEILRLIRSRDPRLAQEAISGAGRAVIYKWASERFRQAVLRELGPLVTGKRKTPRTDTGRFLLHTAVGRYADLEPTHKSVLHSEKCLHTRNPALTPVLFTLMNRRDADATSFRRPATQLLWHLYEAIRARKAVTEPGRSRDTMAAILNLTADTEPVRTQREAKALLKSVSGDGHASKMLHTAIRRCRSVPEAHSCLVWMYEHPGRLAKSAEHVLRAFETAVFVDDEGFPAYFCDAAENWRVAHAGLELIGESAAAAILARGANVLTPGGLPADARRARALGMACTPAQQARLERIGAEYSPHVIERVTAAVERYIASHREEFSAVRP